MWAAPVGQTLNAACTTMCVRRVLPALRPAPKPPFPCVWPAGRTQVDLYENGTIAIVEAVSPELGNRVQRVRVQLPGTSPELLGKFREKKIDFAAHANTEDGGAVFLNLLGEPLPGRPPAPLQRL